MPNSKRLISPAGGSFCTALPRSEEKLKKRDGSATGSLQVSSPCSNVEFKRLTCVGMVPRATFDGTGLGTAPPLPQFQQPYKVAKKTSTTTDSGV